MDVLYQKGRATAAEVLETIPDPPGYSAVRAMLKVLENKGHIRHEQDGARYVFLPTMTRDKAQRSAIRHMIQTFFEGSPEQAVATLLDVTSSKLSDDELDRLEKLIQKAKGDKK
jgi:predicted transcriptional regulator